MTIGWLQPAAVRVPCSTSNLGSGYDTIGLALDRYLEARYEPGEGELDVIRLGTLASLDPDGWDFCSAVFLGALEEEGIEAGGHLEIRSEIPIARGLGSSAASRLAGLELARMALGLTEDRALLFARTARAEGHGDNVAPCLYGGLQAVLPGASGPTPLRLELSQRVGFAYAAPATGLDTERARAALPRLVGHDLAARSVARVVALIRGLAEADPELLRLGTEDELHVPHRLPLIPGAYNAMGAAYEAGAWAVTVSGAGSGLVALCEPERAEEVAAAMHAVFAGGSDESDACGFAVRPDLEGLQRL